MIAWWAPINAAKHFLVPGEALKVDKKPLCVLYVADRMLRLLISDSILYIEEVLQLYGILRLPFRPVNELLAIRAVHQPRTAGRG